MMTSPPQVNGHKRPLPVLGEWQAITQAIEQSVTIEPAAPESSKPDLIAEAEAEAIRARAYAESEARRRAAEAEADAVRIKAKAEAEKQRLANERTAMAAEEKRAAHLARMAKHEAERQETERQAAAAREAAEAEKEAAEVAAKEARNADDSWKYFAVAFAVACAVVALPVQMAAFWNEDSPWMLAAPFMLEGGAWVVLRGAAAAVAAHRPHWHFRLIAWFLALISAGINLWHGLGAFDAATAIGTAFASLAGPGVWDLHEHGRIRRRDGAPTRRERRAAKKAKKDQAAEKAAQAAREEAREQARQEAMEAIEKRLAEQRAQEFPDEWKYALKLSIAKGEATVTEPIWEQTWADLHAAHPGVTANSVSARNVAAKRMERVLERDPANTSSKPASSQRVIQVKTPARRSSYRPTPPRRKPNDTPKFHPVARALAADAKRQSNTSVEEKK